MNDKNEDDSRSESQLETLSEEQAEKILAALDNKGVNKTCPMCGNEEFTLIDGFTYHRLNQDPISGDLKIGGPFIPTIGVICTNCGFLSEHAIGTLGLLEELKEEEKEE